MNRIFWVSVALVVLSATSVLASSGGPCKSKGCAGTFIPVPGDFFFGKECKSKGCGIVRGPTGDLFFGGGCKSKGCPLPPGINIPGVSPSPTAPRPAVPRCCTPDGCLRGYLKVCIGGALTPRLAATGFFSASGSCTGRLKKFNCRNAAPVCTGNRGRCVYKKCGRSRKPSRTPHKMHYPSRILNMTEDTLLSLVRSKKSSTGSFCKSKGCPFGEPDQIIFGGGCKSKGCGIVNSPTGPIYFGGPCKSKGCPLPPGLITEMKPMPEPTGSRPPQPLPPRVPRFRVPGRRACCFARPCRTQRLCRCVRV